jgi:hypothetical protein
MLRSPKPGGLGSLGSVRSTQPKGAGALGSVRSIHPHGLTFKEIIKWAQGKKPPRSPRGF